MAGNVEDWPSEDGDTYTPRRIDTGVGTTPPALVGEYRSLDSINVLHAQDDVLLATARTGESLYRLDITDPAAPRETATYDAFEGCETLQIAGQMAYVGAQDLQVFDLSIPGQLNYAGTLTTTSFVWRLSASGNSVFIGDGSSGVVVADASDLAAPVALNTYPANFVNDIAYGNGYVYVADGSEQILVLEASDPANLTYVTGYNLTTDRVHVWNDYLVARGTQPHTFSIVDVTDPVFIAEYEMPAGAARVTVSGKCAYVGLGARGMLVIKLLLPHIAEVNPDLGPAGWTTLLNLYGDGFAAGASVQIGETTAISATTMSETRIQAMIPATLTPGEYDVTVTNPSGYGHTLDKAFTIVDATEEGVFASPEDLFTSPAPPPCDRTRGLGALRSPDRWDGSIDRLQR